MAQTNDGATNAGQDGKTAIEKVVPTSHRMNAGGVPNTCKSNALAQLIDGACT